MFAKLVSAAWGDDTDQVVAAGDATDQDASTSRASSEDQQDSKPSSTAVPSIWGVAASLADTVKRNTAEITAGLKETNWRAEIEAFGKGVREEEQVLRQETVKRVEVAKEHFPKDATAQLDQKRKELAVHLQKMGVGLGSLGKRVVTGTTDLFDQVKDSLEKELSARGKGTAGARQQPGKLAGAGSKYSRLEAAISSMQRDSATYCSEPADSADYQAWRSHFDLASYRPAVEALTQENAFMAELQARIVPVIVEYDAFWTRYFYQLHLLEARHAQRMELARRASKPQEEELAWDDAEPDDQPDSTLTSQAAQQSPPADVDAQSKLSTEAEQNIESSHAHSDDQTTKEHSDMPLKSASEQAAGTQQTDAAASGNTNVQAALKSESADPPEQDAAAAADTDATDAVTNSDSGSASEHWTVVTSPSKQTETQPKAFSQAGNSAAAAKPKQPPANATECLEHAAGSQETAARAAEANDDNDDIDDLDDVANDDSPGSAGEEDWGSWE